MTFEKHIHLYNHYHNQDTERFYHPKSSLRYLPSLLDSVGFVRLFLASFLTLLKSSIHLQNVSVLGHHVNLFLAVQSMFQQLCSTTMRESVCMEQGERQDGRLILPAKPLQCKLLGNGIIIQFFNCLHQFADLEFLLLFEMLFWFDFLMVQLHQISRDIISEYPSFFS